MTQTSPATSKRLSERNGGRLITRIAALTILGMALGSLGAPAANAHAEIVKMTPGLSQMLTVGPKAAVIEFNEPVSVKAGGVQILDDKGKVLKKSGALTDSTISLSLPSLKSGFYVLRWSVLSADGHPIIGSSAFALNAKSAKATRITITSAKKVALGTLSGDRTGLRTVTYTGVGIEGQAEFRNKLFGAPIIVPLVVSENGMSASVLLPSVGRWDVLYRIKTSAFDETTATGSFTLRP